MKEINDLQAGKVGEYLVCADLILKGYIAFLSEQGLSYDIVFDYKGGLIRLQVKTTRRPKAMPQRKNYTPVYRFNIRRMGKQGRRRYTSEDVDLFALVALDTRTIGYIVESEVKQTMDFRIRAHEGNYYGERHAGRRDKILELRKQGLSFTGIGNRLGLDRGQAWRIANGKEGVGTHGHYLDELRLDDALGRLYHRQEAD